MSFMNKLTVRGKLALAFGCVLLLMGLLGALAVLQLSRVNDQTESLLVYRLPGVRDSLRMAESATRYRTREYRLLVSDIGELPQAAERLKQSEAEFDAARKAYAEFIV